MGRLSSGHVLALVASAAGIIAACGSSGDSTFGNGVAGDDGGSSNPGNFGNGDGDGDGLGDSGSAQVLRIEPALLTVTIGGTLKAPTGGSGTFTAHIGNNPAPVVAKWTLDDIRYATIDAAGKVTGKPIGGKTKVRARVGAAEAVAEVEVKVILTEDFANLGDDVKTKLRAGGNFDGNFKWLYPYDRTVFPRGLPAPTLQFASDKPTAYRVRLKTSRMDVEGFYANVPGTNAARVAVASEWWNAVTFADANETVDVEVTKINGNNVTGPQKVSWRIAPGSLRGSIHYNSYNSPKANYNGAVLTIKPGKSLELLLSGAVPEGQTGETKCVVCHSVSASGNRLVAGIGWWAFDPDWSNPVYSGSFNITASGATRNKTTGDGQVYPFGALTPDGKWMLSTAVVNGVVRGFNAFNGVNGVVSSKLVNVDTNTVVTSKFFDNKDWVAVTPTFSPDGKRLAYSDGAKAVSVATFDSTTTPPSFKDPTPIYTTGNAKLGWPAFTPDGNALFAHTGTSFDTEGGNTADLVWIDVATKKARLLDSLNGKSGNDYYLPYGENEDGHKNYEPTLLPVAVGGYYWVVFTSRRSFGNTIYKGPNSVNAAGDNAYDGGDQQKKGVRKKLWVAAIDINRVADADISHPAFYLEGQELLAGNMRGFWSLDQCKADGATCEGGDECCNGFCRNVEQSDGSTAAQCIPPPAACANETERCTVDADCCTAPAGTKCVNRACTTPGPSTPR